MSEEVKNTAQKQEIDLLEVFIKTWQHRWFIIIFTIIFILLGVAYALLKQPLYTGTAKLYKTEGESGSTSQLQGLASQFGFGGAFGSSEMFNIIDLVESRSIKKKVLLHQWETEKFDHPVNLIEYFEIDAETERKKIHQGLEHLNDYISANTDEETMLTTINVLMPEPELSARVTNYIVFLIEDYIIHEQKMQTRENLKYIQNRLDSVKLELKQAEEALKGFRERNRNIAQSPDLQTRQMRLQRQLTIKQEVYLLLQKELEMTKIELVKETPVINIVDHAEPPALRTEPKRTLIVIISAFLGFFLSLVVLVLWYLWKYLRHEIKARNLLTKSSEENLF